MEKHAKLANIYKVTVPVFIHVFFRFFLQPTVFRRRRIRLWWKTASALPSLWDGSNPDSTFIDLNGHGTPSAYGPQRTEYWEVENQKYQ
jgi:hypothetical protein